MGVVLLIRGNPPAADKIQDSSIVRKNFNHQNLFILFLLVVSQSEKEACFSIVNTGMRTAGDGDSASGRPDNIACDRYGRAASVFACDLPSHQR